MTFSTLSAGVVAAFAGFASSVAVVLAAAEAVRASPLQTVSWVTATCGAVAVTTALLTMIYRIPITTAWSTPGAAIIAASAGAVSFDEAVAGFLFAGALIVLTGLVRPLGRLLARIPQPIASAMLAGVVVRFVVAAFESLVSMPLLIAPLMIAFLLLRVVSQTSAALAVLVGGVGWAWVLGSAPASFALSLSSLTWTMPAFSTSAVIGLALPLYLVTMVSQNLAGAAVLQANGYQVPFNAVLRVTGIASVIIGPLGGHTVNLSAIAAAIAAGPDAHPDPARRWPAGIALAATYALITVFAGSLVALFLALPAELMRTVAGLALMTSLINALTTSMSDPDLTFPAAVTFSLTMSGITVAGIGSPFWGLVAGLAVLALNKAFNAGD